jgi:hypothetical protein
MIGDNLMYICCAGLVAYQAATLGQRIHDADLYDDATPFITISQIDPPSVETVAGGSFSLTYSYVKRHGCSSIVNDRYKRVFNGGGEWHYVTPGRLASWSSGKGKATISKIVPAHFPPGEYLYQWQWSRGSCVAIGDSKATTKGASISGTGPWVRVVVAEKE